MPFSNLSFLTDSLLGGSGGVRFAERVIQAEVTSPSISATLTVPPQITASVSAPIVQAEITSVTVTASVAGPSVNGEVQ